MANYTLPELKEAAPVKTDEAILIASGDLRLSANQTCWAAQEDMEKKVIAAFKKEGIKVKRGHAYDPELKHGFIWNQRMGMDVFKNIHPDAKLIVAESVWQYSHHVLAGLRNHRGPILTVANWSGQWPGLVGLLNLNGSLTKMGVNYSSIWSVDFKDEFFINGIREWIKKGKITHDTSHVQDLKKSKLPKAERALGETLAAQLQQEKAIIGIFDEGCMGMYNAIIDDELLNPTGIYKERLSQSALIAGMQQVKDAEAKKVRQWLDKRGVKFVTGKEEATELTDKQIHEQCKMYIAAVRIAHDYGCAAIGIQYQQGLKDMVPASDLVEGLLNNVERPPVYHATTGEELFAGQALPHFNEVDEGAAVDEIVTNRIWNAMGLDPATTLHDLRYGEHFKGKGVDDYVWVFLISGAAPASHFIDGYAGATSLRQSPMYFRLGGGTLRGISKPGEIVWSRVYVMDGALHADIGRATVVELPQKETERRWKNTSPEWPIMHAVLHGVSRDQMMARHKANHLNVAYGADAESADKALAAKAAMLAAMGIEVHLCGDVKL
ncbi:MAG: fucose isomerase [Chloroflexi bacterium]|nr:fucose isomerase [Chloroflexota bacterium]MCC6895744.1 fucose isomerase [Anaerolineae bacterium]